MNCCRCIVAVRNAPDIAVNAAITIYNGEALCFHHFFNAWEGDDEFTETPMTPGAR